MKRLSAEEEQRRATLNFYNRFSYGVRDARTRERWKQRLGWLPLERLIGRPALDAGCGLGVLAQTLDELGLCSHGLDLSSTCLARVRQRLPHLPLIRGDLLSLPLAAESFDLVVAVGSLHHTPDCARAFAECARVTRAGGHIVIALYTRFHPYYLVYRFFRTGVLGRSPEEMPRWVRAGFRSLLRRMVGHEVSAEEADNLLADQLFSPVASFHSAGDVRGMARRNGLRQLGSETVNLGQFRIYRFVKN